MKLLLTSNFPMKKNEAVAERIHSLIDGNRKLLFVGYNDTTAKYIRLLHDYGFTDTGYLNLNKGFTAEGLKDYDGILLHGGNPFSITTLLRETAFIEYLKNTTKLIITVSGSTCALSKEFSLLASFYPAWNGGEAAGIGIFGYEPLPHLHRYKKHMKEIHEYSRNRIVYGIPDGSAILCVSGDIELLGAAGMLGR